MKLTCMRICQVLAILASAVVINMPAQASSLKLRPVEVTAKRVPAGATSAAVLLQSRKSYKLTGITVSGVMVGRLSELNRGLRMVRVLNSTTLYAILAGVRSGLNKIGMQNIQVLASYTHSRRNAHLYLYFYPAKPATTVKRTVMQGYAGRNLKSYMRRVAKKPCTSRLIKYNILANRIPGVNSHIYLVPTMHHGQTSYDLFSMAHLERFGGYWALSNGGAPVYGSMFMSGGVHVNGILGGDRLGMNVSTTSKLSQAYRVAADYRKVITSFGTQFRFGYVLNRYRQPLPQTFFRYNVNGDTYQLSFYQPILVSYVQQLDTFLGFDYATGNEIGYDLSGAAAATDLNARVREPYWYAGMNYAIRTGIGRFMANAVYAQGFSLFSWLQARYDVTGRPNNIFPTQDPDMRFKRMNFNASQQIVLPRDFSLMFNAGYQWDISNTILPQSQKYDFVEGAYYTQGYFGDSGFQGTAELDYQPALLAYKFIPINFFVNYGIADLSNKSTATVPQSVTPQTVSMGMRFRVPQAANIRGFVQLGKPINHPLAVTYSNGWFFLFGFSQTF